MKIAATKHVKINEDDIIATIYNSGLKYENTRHSFKAKVHSHLKFIMSTHAWLDAIKLSNICFM